MPSNNRVVLVYEGEVDISDNCAAKYLYHHTGSIATNRHEHRQPSTGSNRAALFYFQLARGGKLVLIDTPAPTNPPMT